MHVAGVKSKPWGCQMSDCQHVLCCVGCLLQFLKAVSWFEGAAFYLDVDERVDWFEFFSFV